MSQSRSAYFIMLQWSLPLSLGVTPMVSMGQSDRDLSRQLDRDPNIQRAFAMDLEQGLKATDLSSASINDILQPLIDVQLVTPAIKGRRPESGVHSQSLAAISNDRIALLDMGQRLRVKYGIQDLPPMGASITGYPVKFPPAMESWLNLRLANMKDSIPTARNQIALGRPELEPLKWARPIRVASTGNPLYDEAISRALERLRVLDPGIPIDKQSFPNTVKKANVFVHWHGVICTKHSPCHRGVPEATYSSPPFENSPWKVPLVFFDQIAKGEWRATSPIYAFTATYGTFPALAWTRTNGAGRIETAVCSGVMGPATGGSDTRGGTSRPAAVEAVSDAIEACLAAAMGAPTELIKDWPLPNYGRDPHDALPTGEQQKALRRLYSGRSS